MNDNKDTFSAVFECIIPFSKDAVVLVSLPLINVKFRSLLLTENSKYTRTIAAKRISLGLHNSTIAAIGGVGFKRNLVNLVVRRIHIDLRGSPRNVA